MLKIKVKDFIKSLEGTYSDDEYFTVVGWDIELENFSEECKIRHIPMESKLYPVCVFKGVSIKGIFFSKDVEDKVKKIVYDNGGYGRLVMNGKNPF